MIDGGRVMHECMNVSKRCRVELPNLKLMRLQAESLHPEFPTVL